MNSFEVRFCAQYFVGDGDMRQDDYHATRLVKFVKGQECNGYSDVSIGGRNRRIKNSNRDVALAWFAQWAVAQVKGFGGGIPKVLIPVPPSAAAIDYEGDARTSQIASGIALKCSMPIVVADAVRWLKVATSSHQGGPRDADSLHDNLVTVDTIPQGDCILVDDVFTTGAHLTAVGRLLRDDGRVVAGAVCCGRTVWDQLDHPFNVEPETVWL